MTFQDKDLERELISKIAQNDAICGLVHQMQPLDVVKCIQNTFEIVPQKAIKLTLNLLVNMKLKEWSSPGIETNKQYPVPNKKISDENEVPNEIKEYGFSNPKPEVPRDAEFPPPPRQSASEFPYDSNTLFITDPKIKGKKRPLLQNYEPKAKSDKVPPPGGGRFCFISKTNTNY